MYIKSCYVFYCVLLVEKCYCRLSLFVCGDLFLIFLLLSFFTTVYEVKDLLNNCVCIHVVFTDLLLLALKTLEASGLNVTMEDVADTDHFNIIEQLVDGEYYLTKVHAHKSKKSKIKAHVNFQSLYFV